MQQNNLKVSVCESSDSSIKLRYATFTPADGQVKKWLVFCNGRTEWIEKYDHLIQEFVVNRSYGFLTFDHRGQGMSGGSRAWIQSYDHYANDMGKIISSVVGTSEYFVISHSMGGLVSLYASMKGVISPKALVLCSPMLGLPRVPLPHYIARPLSKLVNICGLGKLSTGGGSHSRPPFEFNQLTHSIERYSEIQNIPYPVPSATFGWVDASFGAVKFVHSTENLKQFNVPTFILMGSTDSVVDRVAPKKWVDELNLVSPGVGVFEWIPGGKHELLFESQEYYDKAVQMINNWLVRQGL